MREDVRDYLFADLASVDLAECRHSALHANTTRVKRHSRAHILKCAAKKLS